MASSTPVGLGALVASALVACSAGAPRPAPGGIPDEPAWGEAAAAGEAADAGPARGDAGAPPPIDAGPPLTEIEARLYLTGRFRDAGFRIRHDVVVRGEGYAVTLDGYDPQARVGFEYVAAEEAGTDPTAAEMEALRGRDDVRVLILEAAEPRRVRVRTELFLVQLRTERPG